MVIGNITGDGGVVYIRNCMVWSKITVNMAKNGSKMNFGGFGGLKMVKNRLKMAENRHFGGFGA